MSPSSHSLLLCSLLEQHFSKEHLNLLSPITLFFLAYVQSSCHPHHSSRSALVKVFNGLCFERPVVGLCAHLSWPLSNVWHGWSWPLEAPPPHGFLDITLSWFSSASLADVWQSTAASSPPHQSLDAAVPWTLSPWSLPYRHSLPQYSQPVSWLSISTLCWWLLSYIFIFIFYLVTVYAYSICPFECPIILPEVTCPRFISWWSLPFFPQLPHISKRQFHSSNASGQKP